MNTYIIERTILYKVQDSHLKNLILRYLELEVNFKRFRTYRESYPDGHLTGCEVGRIDINLPKKNLDKYVAIMRLGVGELQNDNRNQQQYTLDDIASCTKVQYHYSEHDRRLLGIFLDYVTGQYDSWYQNESDEEYYAHIYFDINSVK